jgi:hypothetical protein
MGAAALVAEAPPDADPLAATGAAAVGRNAVPFVADLSIGFMGTAPLDYLTNRTALKSRL